MLLAHTVFQREGFYLHNHFPLPLAKFLSVLPEAGRSGVDMFFTLSSYLLTTLLLRERKLIGGIDVRKFYLRRILRIWPVYFLVIGATLLIAHVDPEEQMDGPHALAMLLFSGNWALSYFPINTLALPLWSVAVEEQFYSVWPWVVRRSVRFIAITCAVVWVTSYALRWHAVMYPGPRGFNELNTLYRIDPIVFGVVLALVLQGALPTLRSWQRYFLIGFGGFLLWMGAYFGAPALHAGRAVGALVFFPLADLGCVLILAACMGIRDVLIGPVMRSRPLVYLGRISYGLYAYQGIVFWLVAARATAWLHRQLDHLHHGDLWLAISWVLIALCFNIAAAALSFELMEKPILRFKERFANVRSRPGG